MPAGFYHFLPVDAPALLDGDPTDATLNREVLEQFGLADVLADVTHCPNHCVVTITDKGPNGQPGVVIYPKPSHGEDPRSFSYNANRQTWVPVPGLAEPKRYIGWDKDEPPRPEDLERQRNWPGYLVKDGHDRQWSIPVARSPRASLGILPCDFTFDASGKPITQLKPEYEPLWEAAGEIYDFFHGDPHGLESDVIIQHAAAALAVNYRVGTAELSALHAAGVGVLDTLTVQSIVKSLIDFDTEEEFKKKEPSDNTQPAGDGSNSTPGTQVDDPDTGQRTEN